MKLFKVAQKYGAKVAAVSVAGVSSAFAAVPTTVTDGITASQTDGVTIAWAGLGMLIALIAFKYIRRGL